MCAGKVPRRPLRLAFLPSIPLTCGKMLAWQIDGGRLAVGRWRWSASAARLATVTGSGLESASMATGLPTSATLPSWSSGSPGRAGA
jgi:hypothetical protein